MASGHKELGQIHTLNFEIQGSTSQTHDLDISGALTAQLQRLVRQGHFFKCVGIDLAVSEFGGNEGGVTMNGTLRYYAPTRGRCQAYRSAFAAMRNAMTLQGINMRDNEQYDFRVSFNGEAGNALVNQASLDGTNPLILYDRTGGLTSTKGVFNVHNRGVQPNQKSAAPDFGAGFNTMGVQGSPTDFVLNDGIIWTGNEDWADEDFEEIPFQLAFTPTSNDTAFIMNWRPDPALYLAIMTGLIQVDIDEVDLEGDATDYVLEIAVHISGWKSIMGNPDKKKKRSSRGRRRKSKK